MGGLFSRVPFWVGFQRETKRTTRICFWGFSRDWAGSPTPHGRNGRAGLHAGGRAEMKVKKQAHFVAELVGHVTCRKRGVLAFTSPSRMFCRAWLAVVVVCPLFLAVCTCRRAGVPDSAKLQATVYMKQKYKWQALLALEDLDGWLWAILWLGGKDANMPACHCASR